MAHGSDKKRDEVNGKAAAEKVLLEAEQFRAQIHKPKGKSGEFDWERMISNLDDDDEFFHVTCHIDQSLKTKIERGEYIDL